MVERQTGERRADIGAAEDGRDLFGGKQAAEELGEELRGARRELGGFQHHPVAGRERGDQRHDRQLERVIPRADDADDADRLMENAGAGGHEFEAHRDALGRRPTRQMPDRVADRRERRPHVGEQRLVARAVAEVAGDLQCDPLGVVLDRPTQSSQVGAALLKRRRPRLEERLALPRQDLLHCLGADVRASFRHADHAHDLAPRPIASRNWDLSENSPAQSPAENPRFLRERQPQERRLARACGERGGFGIIDAHVDDHRPARGG